MSLLDSILTAGGGAAVQQLGSQFGLGQNQTASALSALVPALAAGLHQNVQREGGLADLIGALSTGGHQKYINDPTTLTDAATIDEGKKILGHVLGSKDVSRQVASQAAAETGLGEDVLKKMLPMAATLVMGVLANRTPASPSASAGLAPNAAPDLMGLLGASMGSPTQASGVLGMIGKLFTH